MAFACEQIGESHADMSLGSVEVYAAGNATMALLALAFSYVPDEMGLDFPSPFILEMDNEAARIFSHNSAQKTKMKHIDCRQHWVRCLRDRGICTLAQCHVDTKENLADLFTKILDSATFEGLRDQVLKPYITKTTEYATA